MIHLLRQIYPHPAQTKTDISIEVKEFSIPLHDPAPDLSRNILKNNRLTLLLPLQKIIKHSVRINPSMKTSVHDRRAANPPAI